MRRRSILASVALAAVLALPAAGYEVNKDLQNLGPDAHDLAILLAGQETVTETFPGYPPGGGYLEGKFHSISSGPSGPNTLIHWQSFDGPGPVIKNGKKLHVGYSTADCSSRILDMYWTDPSGNRIPGSVVYNITSGWRYSTTGTFSLVFENRFAAEATISIRNLRVAVWPQPFPLAELSNGNRALIASLQPVAASLDLRPGEERSATLPERVPEGSSVIAVYDVVGSGNDAVSTDFVQMQAVPAGGCGGGAIPQN
jgi:hypothetical protein